MFSLRKMAKFTAEQKKFIVKSFARNTSATQVRREFLLANEIQGRKRDQYHLKDFSRVNDHFEKNGSILKTPVKVSDGKWSLLSRASKKSGMASTQIQGHEERLLVDARWRPSSLHQFSKGYSYWEVPGQSDQSRNAHHLASWLPGLNPLDFHFWGVAQQQVYQEYPEAIQSLIDCVKSFAAWYDSSVIERIAANVVKRAKLCLDANGGHFQHLLK